MIVHPDPLSLAARRRPDGLGIIDTHTGARLTYRSLHDRVERLAGGLIDEGVSPGERVVFLGEHGVRAVTLIHAVWRCGATVVPIDPSLPSERQRHRLERIDPTLTVGERSVDAPGAFTALENLANDPPQRELPNRDPSSPACILFTSGTSGDPRAVTLTMDNLQSSAVASASRLGIEPTDRWMVPLAPYHMGGVAPIMRTALAATTLVTASFNGDEIRQLIERLEITMASVVPTMLRRDLESSAAFSNLRVLLVGGDRTPPALVRQALAADVPIYVSYGMTETASQVATAPPARLECDPETVGRPLRFLTVTTRDYSDTDEIGEIVVSGPTVSPGYLDEEDDERFPGSGTLRTGDAGYLDGEWLYIVGRIDDRIVSGGVTVDPVRIADTIRSHSAISDVCIVGVQDAEWGERVCALVEGTAIPAEEIEAYLRERLTDAERPKDLEWTRELPRTPSGTIDREAVRMRFIEHDTGG